MPRVVVDASLVLLWFLHQEGSAQADILLDRWRDEETELVAPPLLLAEVSSVLRSAVYRHQITDEEGDAAFETFLEMEIAILQPPDLLPRAWTLGRALNASRLYALNYLALAQIETCPLWTADRRFHRLASPRSSGVRWVGEVTDGP